ncbi:hypothetical protein B0T22DRAFT_539826 [Podospora appendiculata]|uniref:Uncharacterized protein n=1 Tax=Podospora appendiculata TaxID=314037 RepID=A0AAE0X1R7_9PEZI|nr:hypothetical protein B0T22DRAFT_539826 [Podospora appendiculata]
MMEDRPSSTSVSSGGAKSNNPSGSRNGVKTSTPHQPSTNDGVGWLLQINDGLYQIMISFVAVMCGLLLRDNLPMRAVDMSVCHAASDERVALAASSYLQYLRPPILCSTTSFVMTVFAYAISTLNLHLTSTGGVGGNKVGAILTLAAVAGVFGAENWAVADLLYGVLVSVPLALALVLVAGVVFRGAVR